MKRVVKGELDCKINKEDIWPSIEASLKLFLEEIFEGKFS